MITLKEACKIVRDNNLEIGGCLETKNWYNFTILKNGMMLNNSSTFSISKASGKAKWVQFFNAPEEFRNDPMIHFYEKEELDSDKEL